VEVQPRDAEGVYVNVPGKIVETIVEPGQQVSSGQVLARLDNIDLHLSVAELEGQYHEVETQLNNLRRQRFQDAGATPRISQAQELLAAVKEQLDRKREELGQLVIMAPIAGMVLPPQARPEQSKTADGRLPEWSGMPMDKRNIGAHLSQGDVICQIGDPEALEAVLVIDQHDIELVTENDEVDIQLDATPGVIFTTTIEEIAKIDLKRTSASLASQAGGQIDTRVDASGAVVPISTSYQARAPLEKNEESLRVGYRGQAKIYTGWQSLRSRLWRLLARSFHFEL
jgi:putative peptide zinc metalloprotease protein